MLLRRRWQVYRCSFTQRAYGRKFSGRIQGGWCFKRGIPSQVGDKVSYPSFPIQTSERCTSLWNDALSNRNPGNVAYMPHSKKFTQELVSKSARVNANIGVSHIDQIVSESPTSSTEWSRHSIIFADAAVHFPNYDLDLLFWPKLLSSFVRVILRASLFFGFLPCEKYYARRNEIWQICRARIQIASVRVPYA